MGDFYTQLSCWQPIKGVRTVTTSRWYRPCLAATGKRFDTGDTMGEVFPGMGGGGGRRL